MKNKVKIKIEGRLHLTATDRRLLRAVADRAISGTGIKAGDNYGFSRRKRVIVEETQESGFSARIIDRESNDYGVIVERGHRGTKPHAVVTW